MKATVQIFLSYARQDEEKVENLYQKLSKAGFKPWMDKKDILPGERWPSSIRKAIQRSDFFLVCLSKNAVDRRGWIRREIRNALDIWQEKLEDDIYLIPVRLDDCEVPESLRDFQWVNLFEENGWTLLVKAIQVGMERQAELAKPVVQESTPLEPYSVHDKLSQEFKVTIGKTLEGIEYPIHVSSPAGSVTGVLVLPFSGNQIEQALQNFREGIPFGRYRRRRTRGETQDELSPAGFGSALFRALFSDEVLALYRESLSMVGKPDVVNRMPVKLNIAAREITRLPWELLYDPEKDDFLSFGKETPIIRFVDSEPRPYTFDPPLRILLVSANPTGTALLDLEHEREVIGEALDTLKREDKVRIDHLFGATVPALRTKIRAHEPHVVHFMGHGQVNRLLLESKEGGKGSSFVESSLGIILRNASSLRMVVLNACETARPADSEERLGLTRGLARRGVPAIVAMQFQISDEAACQFVEELYRVLAEGLGVDEAVLWGRIAVQSKFVDDIEWVTPVLYMQTQEGQILDDLLKGPETEVDELSAMRRERTEVLQKQLRIHERNLWRLEEQKAKFGIRTPLDLENAIDEQKAAIKQIWGGLNQLGVDKEAIEPQERPDVEILDSYQEDAAIDVKRRVTDIVMPEGKPPDSRLLEQVQTYYEQGLRYFDQGEWVRALSFLEDVRRLAPGYKDAQRLVRTAREELAKQETERRTREKQAALYKQALAYCDQEHWQAAIDLFNEILDIDPNYRDVQVQAEEARQAYAQQLAEERTRLQLETLYQRAQAYLEAEDWRRAVGLLEQVVGIDRDYADVLDQLNEALRRKQLVELYAKGEEAFVAQDWEQAVANFGAAFAIDQSYRDVEEKLEQARQQRRWDALHQEGLEYLDAERWDEAIEALREVQPDPKRRKDVRLARLYAEGRQYAAQEKWESALAKFEKIIEENPQYWDAAGQLQEMRRRKRLHDLYTEGVKRTETEEWRQAIRAFEQIVREAPDYRDVQRRLALVEEEAELVERYASGKRFFDLGRWSEAIQDLQSVVKVRPDYPNAQKTLEGALRERELADLYAEGMRCLAQGQWQEAIGALEKLMNIAPDYRDAATQLDNTRKKKSLTSAYEQGTARYERGDWAGAIHHLEQVMRCEEKGYRDAAVLLAEARRQERLAQQYQKGLDYQSGENWDKAISYFEQVMELDQNYRNAAEQLAEARLQRWLADTYDEAKELMQAEQWKDAAAVLQQVLEKDPHYQQAPAMLTDARRQDRVAELYAAANQAYEQGRWTEAIERFQQILAEDTKYRDVEKKVAEAQWQQGLKENYERGMACFGRGDWEGAIWALKAVVEKDPNYKDAFVRLSEGRRQQALASYYAEGERCMAEERWDEAIATFEKVVGIDSHYREVEGRLDEANRQKRLSELYATGEEHLVTEKWEPAVEYFRRVLEIDKTYKCASEKLWQAERERNLESLYSRGLQSYAAEKWSEALESWGELVALEPNYRDVAIKVKEAEQRKTLDDTYAVGVASLTMGDWEQAVTAFERIIEIDADYQNTGDLLREAEQGRWADWKSRMLSSLQDSGELTANSLDYIPERLRIDTMGRFYEEHAKNLELALSTDFQVLTLLDFDLVSALREIWGAMLKATE